MKHEPGRNLERMKEVKVLIPINQHIRLHSVKVLTGKPISDTVSEALEQYFQTNGVASARSDAKEEYNVFPDTIE